MPLNNLLKLIIAACVGIGIVPVQASPVIEARQAPSLPAGWTAIGCYSDSTSSRTLRIAAYTDVTGMTIESCIAFCTPAGYKYAGVEFARECYCDNVIESPGAPISSSTCNMACTGNAAEICGGAGGIDIFQSSTATTTTTPPPTTTTTTTTPPPPTATPTIVHSVGAFQYQGCYQDGVSGLPRSLIHQLSVTGGVTAESCTAACSAAGYILAGLEYGQECWCDSYMPLAVLVPDTDCNMVCVAGTTELCGAGNRLAVYVNSNAPPLNLQTCLGSVQLQSTNPPIFNFDLEGHYIPAFPGAPVSVPGILGNFQEPQTPNIEILVSRFATQPHTYSIASGGGLTAVTTNPFPGFTGAWAMQPIAGTEFFFEINPTGPSSAIGFQFCALPNFLSASTYIGPPLLGVNFASAVWAFCPIGVTYLHNSTNGPCSDIVLAMTPPIV